MTVRELRELMERRSDVGDDIEVTVFGVGHGMPLELTGEWSRAPGDGQPILLHSRVKDEPNESTGALSAER